MQGLGFAIIAAACIVKVPQIVKIAEKQSADGLSLLSFELEQLALSVHATYGFTLALPFSAYGEAVVLILQNTFLLAQIYYLSKAPVWRPFLAVSLFGTALACISAGISSDRMRFSMFVVHMVADKALMLRHYVLSRSCHACHDKSCV